MLSPTNISHLKVSIVDQMWRSRVENEHYFMEVKIKFNADIITL